MVGTSLPVLIFDGDCGFCTHVARRIEARWPEASAASAVASQSLDNDTLASLGLRRSQVAEAAWWVDAQGTHGGDRAVAAALVEAGGWLALLGRFLGLPGIAQLAPPGYRLVAKYRHRLPGATEACRIDDHTRGQESL